MQQPRAKRSPRSQVASWSNVPARGSCASEKYGHRHLPIVEDAPDSSLVDGINDDWAAVCVGLTNETVV